MSEVAYAPAPGLRTREVLDADTLLVFAPEPPKVHWLNLSGWLLFDLCDGAPADDVADRYAEAVSDRFPRDEARDHALAYLDDLVTRGVLVAGNPEPEGR